MGKLNEKAREEVDRKIEEMVEDLMNEKINSREEIATKLNISLRRLHEGITRMEQRNRPLYERYVSKFPYQPKAREDINFRALVINMMKGYKTLQEASEEYNVSVKTITRKVKEMEHTEPELITLYRKYADHLRRRQAISYEVGAKIEMLENAEPVIRENTVEKKEKEIIQVIKDFEQLVNSGMSKDEAAKKLGYGAYPTIWKKYQELKRIQTERQAKKLPTSKEKAFRQSLEVGSQNDAKINISNNPQNTTQNSIDKSVEDVSIKTDQEDEQK